MPAGACSELEGLPSEARAIVDSARRGFLSTLNRDGTVATVPVCFALSSGAIVTAIDHKPKTTSEPARLRNLRRDPRATLLFDRWDEEWSRLGWVMVKGTASIKESGRGSKELAARYPQYAERAPAGPVIVIAPRAITWWTWR